MMPSNKIATNNTVELTFGGTTSWGFIRVLVKTFDRIFYEKFSTEASNNSPSVDCCSQALVIMGYI